MSSSDVLEVSAGRERILDVAVAVLETRGEAALRIAEVAEAANVALGLISYHFGGRDGLIVAAQQRRFAGLVRDDGAVMKRVLEKADTYDDVMTSLSDLTYALLDSRRDQIRMSRIAAIASTFGRDDAYEITSAIVDQLLNDYAELITDAQHRDLIRDDLDARAVATFIQSYALGLVIHDLDPSATGDAELHQVIMTAVEALLRPAR